MTSSSSATQLSTTISSSPSSTSSIPLVPSSSLNPQHTGGHITCVIIGDCSVGKSSLVVSYTTNDFPTQYVPTAFDNYSVDVSVGTRLVHFDICDTGGKVNSIYTYMNERTPLRETLSLPNTSMNKGLIIINQKKNIDKSIFIIIHLING
jgi:small GTP-binding protein